jgi:DNA-directed RNA polymerase specialized sigma24 family protein
MTASATRTMGPSGVPPELVRAFRELHGPRLHGFALLLTLGDRARAARVAGDALSAGTTRIAELRHPERAAAWLRHRVTRAVAHDRQPVRHRPGGDAVVALGPLGVDGAALAGLAVLSTRERSALIADSIERLDRRDVATIVGTEGPRLERLIRRARERYAAAVAAQRAGGPAGTGPTATRIAALAAQALG